MVTGLKRGGAKWTLGEIIVLKISKAFYVTNHTSYDVPNEIDGATARHVTYVTSQ